MDFLIFFGFESVGLLMLVMADRIAAIANLWANVIWGDTDWFLNQDGRRNFMRWSFRLFGLVWMALVGFGAYYNGH